MNHPSRFAFAAPLAVAICLSARFSFANGRFPAADQLVVDPSDPTHIVARTTFGFLETRDQGKQWLWTCEDLIGRIANQDPPFAVTGDGSWVVAVPFEGVSVTHDHGCTWTRAPSPLAEQLAVDVTLEPSDPAALLVLTSTNDTKSDAGPGAPQEFLNLVFETKDNGVTWALLGAPLARDLIASTIEIARSDANRIYASGIFGEPIKAAIERSEDGGKTWTRALVPADSDLGGVYISAVDAQNADRLFVRVLGQPDPATAMTPTTLLESTDKGSSWREVARTQESMLGFALSPDGTMLAYGTIGQGVFAGPSDGSAPLVKVSEIQNRCLTWSPAGLYACGTDLGRDPSAMTPSTQPPPKTFAIGVSRDMGKSYDTLYKLFQTCPATCPDDSRFNQICRMVWLMRPGVTAATGATGETCTVPWARMEVPDSGSTGGVGGGAGAGGIRDGGTDGGSAGGNQNGGTGGGIVNPQPPGDDGCSCHLTGRTGQWPSAALWTCLGATLAWLLRMRSVRHRPGASGRDAAASATKGYKESPPCRIRT